jgi:hypothetical protein
VIGDKRQTLTITKQLAFFNLHFFGPRLACSFAMSAYSRLVQYHTNSRPSFVLFTELLAFIGSMAAIVGIGFLREFL